jgi:hypothetical protein
VLSRILTRDDIPSSIKDYSCAFTDGRATGCMPIYTGNLLHPLYLPQVCQGISPLSIILPCRIPNFNNSLHPCWRLLYVRSLLARPIGRFYRALGMNANGEKRTWKVPAASPYCRLEGSTNSERRMTGLGSSSGCSLRVFLLHRL